MTCLGSVRATLPVLTRVIMCFASGPCETFSCSSGKLCRIEAVAESAVKPRLSRSATSML